VIVTVVALAVLAAGAGVAYALTRRDGNAPAGAGTVSVSPKLPPVPVAATGRPLSHDDPLRLWVGGDSLAGAFGPALGDTVDATGIVKTDIDYKVSSGLADSGLRNWPKYVQEQMDKRDPEAVMFIIGTNDTSVVNSADNNRDGVADWEPVYRERVARMMDTFVGGDKKRTVFWLGPPTLGQKDKNAGALQIGRLMKDEAAKHGPTVVYVDTYALFEGPTGGYDRSVEDERGTKITARIADGVHFTEGGAQYLARMAFSLLDARYGVTQQADPSQPIAWSFATPDAERVPGYTALPRPRTSGGGSSTRTSTPPSTVAGGPTTVAGGGTATTVPKPTATTVPKPPPSTPATAAAGGG